MSEWKKMKIELDLARFACNLYIITTTTTKQQQNEKDRASRIENVFQATIFRTYFSYLKYSHRLHSHFRKKKRSHENNYYTWRCDLCFI
jgi:hypothetical protein